jgi:hypothetical protein
MAVQYLIDGTGRIWDPYDSDLLAELGEVDPDFDLVDYCVRNLGMIQIAAAVADGCTAVRFRWLAVTQTALKAAASLLTNLPAGPVEVLTAEDHWTSKRFEDAAEAAIWLTAERLTTMNVSFQDVVVVPRGLNQLAERRLNSLTQDEDRLALLFKKWRIASQAYSPDVSEFMVKFGLLDRAVLVRENEDKTFVFEHVGTRINMYADEAWRYNTIGKPVTDQPDGNYAKYVQSMMQEVKQSKTPKFDHVDAIIRDGRGAHRTRYDRLVLPWRYSNDTVIVTTLSYKTDTDQRL